MNRSTKSLAYGLALAALVFGIGQVLRYHFHQRVLLDEAKCQQEFAERRTPDKRGEGLVIENEYPLCNRWELADLSLEQLSGVQLNIAKAHTDMIRVEKAIWPMTLVIAVVSVIPALWYFLLRRMAEVMEVIRGKPPTG